MEAISRLRNRIIWFRSRGHIIVATRARCHRISDLHGIL
ncbi:hypothetical protein SXCC_00798 [Gluconacetobacter sp. SXCC-1]|nr:hypothetical protein SXCC_00798 [Gluconacetobacter sp. SXCC-1]